MINPTLLITLILCISVGMAQFSSFVPSYLLPVPKAFITPVNMTESLDQYIKFKSKTIIYSAPTFIQTFGSEAKSPIVETVCTFPFVLYLGVCQCPRGLRFAFGKCLGATTEDYEVPNQGGNQGGSNGGNNTQVECPLLKLDFIPQVSYLEGLAVVSRTYDGSENNQNFRSWGSAFSQLERRAQPSYIDGIRTPVNNLPSPRVISNTIGSQTNPIKRSRLNATLAFTIFGQFIDHDIDLTFSQRSTDTQPAEAMDIEIPANDPFFKGQTKIGFTRSQFVEEPGRVRQQQNQITSWIDGSQIYGSDNDTICALREFKNGKLKISGTEKEQLLPLFGDFFRAGDIRALENVVLTSFHTIFLREHNRLCDLILTRNPSFNDETIFQIARNYVIGLLQKIVLKDYVPLLLGDSANQIIGKYSGYKQNLNPNIPTEFSTAAYRFGHSLLANTFPAINQTGHTYQQFSLNDLFFGQQFVNNKFVADILRGASKTLAKERSSQLVDDVRNLLVLDPTNRQIKLDLFSLNIQRGRDHGLPTYNDARSAFGLARIKTFEELFPLEEIAIANRLKSIYGTPDKIELFVGIICEKYLNNAILGELGVQIVGQTFRNLRDADRFWYERAYPALVVSEIDNTSLGDIIARNTKQAGFNKDIFRFNGY